MACFGQDLLFRQNNEGCHLKLLLHYAVHDMNCIMLFLEVMDEPVIIKLTSLCPRNHAVSCFLIGQCLILQRAHFCVVSAEMPLTCVNSANNFCYVRVKVTFATQKHRVTFLATTVKNAYPITFILAAKLEIRTRGGSPHMVQHLCNKSSPMVGQEKEIYALCSAGDLERAYRSYQQWLPLHGASS